MVDMNIVDDNIRHILYGNTAMTSNLHISSSPINSLKAIEDEFMLECYSHAWWEHNPKRLVLDHGVAERTRFGVNRVVVFRVGHHVETPVSAANGVAAETDATVS